MTGLATSDDTAPSRPANVATPRRVLWVTKGLGRGGAERLAVSCAPHFDPTRFTVDVAYVLPHKDALVPELRASGVAVFCVGSGGASVDWVRALLRLVRDGGYDLVHTHSPVTALPLRALPRRRRPPLVHTEHNVWCRYRRPTRVANAVTYAANASVLAVSDGVRASVRRPAWLPGLRFPRVTTLHHGIDPETTVRGAAARDAARRALSLPLQVPVIGTVGNLTPKKNHALLIAAIRRLRRDHPGVRLVIVGSGPLEHQLRQLVNRAGLQRVVMLAGSRDDVPRLLPALDVFALSSLHEGLSIALLEAMATGVPPVATAVGGVPEVIDHEVNGLLVTPRSADQLAGAIGRLLDEPHLRRTLADAAERRSHDFGIARAVRVMEDWYEEVLA